MTDALQWIGAQVDDTKLTVAAGNQKAHDCENRWPELPVPACADAVAPQQTSWEGDALGDANPELQFYRKRTVKLLHRYQRFSLETGRLPSLLGREFFRTKVTSYRSVTFEDRVIFVRDVEKLLERLDYWDQQLIARVILQEHSYDHAAYLLHCSRKTIQRRLPEVLDLLSQDFLQVGLLVEFAEDGGS